ncbi:RNA polymerase II transcription factor B subunit 4 [Naviculisporaceae sp. PSN 640]
MPAAQDVVDASEHYHGEQTQGVVPSLLSVIIDTNPRAWSALSNVLSLTQAVGNILVYINTHLASDNANEVSIIAAHCRGAVWLYPTPPKPSSSSSSSSSKPTTSTSNSGKEFPKFAQIKASVFEALRTLAAKTTEDDISSTTTTQISGALTLSLAQINKTSISLTAGRGAVGATGVGPVSAPTTTSTTDGLPGLNARILVVSVSDSNPAQYIPTMNAVFAAAHSQIPIDTLCLRGEPTFLQQASYLTGGAFIRAKEPQGIIQYLMFGLGRCPPSLDFGSDNKGDSLLSAKGKKAGSSSNKKAGGVGGSGTSSGRGGNPLVIPNAELVDFRAACFCHRKVVDTGFVCSVCLSIFCEVPPEGECLTCKSKLQLGNYGAKPVVA